MAGGDVTAEQDRVMKDDGQTWGRRAEGGAVEPSSSTGRRGLFALRFVELTDSARSHLFSFLSMGTDSSRMGPAY